MSSDAWWNEWKSCICMCILHFDAKSEKGVTQKLESRPFWSHILMHSHFHTIFSAHLKSTQYKKLCGSHIKNLNLANHMKKTKQRTSDFYFVFSCYLWELQSILCKLLVLSWLYYLIRVESRHFDTTSKRYWAHCKSSRTSVEYSHCSCNQ